MWIWVLVVLFGLLLLAYFDPCSRDQKCRVQKLIMRLQENDSNFTNTMLLLSLSEQYYFNIDEDNIKYYIQIMNNNPLQTQNDIISSIDVTADILVQIYENLFSLQISYPKNVL